ncbi:hypothetical protein MANES_09G056350v8 [Manihot esculenta]|uniref:Uncharacterized protein n=1 Tax=Manihot esculenta TaxID=3983 RepID=A0A2C9V9U6_MANES|nr:hypothetical protein MANES_09G056350v8 [Manihot esculenta]
MASAVLSECCTTDMEDEEEELFEIDLDAVDRIPPPHYWESYFTATSSALLANCLLPIADVSCAVPTSSTLSSVLSLTEHLVFFRFQNFQDFLGHTDEKNRT